MLAGRVALLSTAAEDRAVRTAVHLTRPRAGGAQKSERILELAQRLGMADDREDQMRRQLREQA